MRKTGYLFLGLFIFFINVHARNVFVFKDADKKAPFEDSVLDIHGRITMESGQSTINDYFSLEDGLKPEVICSACLQVSKEIEKVLRDPKFLEKLAVIASDACHILPSDLNEKCIHLSGKHITKALLFLREYFSEENLCNSTGLCAGGFSHEHFSLLAKIQETNFPSEWFNTKVSDAKSCTTCRNAIDQLREILKNPETKIKLIRVLLKACESIQDHVQQCKKLVFEYGPVILANIEKYLNDKDLCLLLHVCDDVNSVISSSQNQMISSV